MKKIITILLLVMTVGLFFTSCSKDEDEETFDYPMKNVYGTWKATTLVIDGKWYDVTKYPYTKFAMSITFYESGRFYGYGYLGNGGGTYKAEGKTITTYVDNEVYATYTVISMSSNYAHLKLAMGSQSIEMYAEKESLNSTSY